MQKAIPIAAICTAQVDQVGIKDRTVFFIPLDHINHCLLGLLRIIETGTAVAGLHPSTIVLHHQLLIILPMLMQWFQYRLFSSSLISS
ncbi:hypothetical protein D3C71_1069560 [compost metagenome]